MRSILFSILSIISVYAYAGESFQPTGEVLTVRCDCWGARNVDKEKYNHRLGFARTPARVLLQTEGNLPDRQGWRLDHTDANTVCFNAYRRHQYVFSAGCFPESDPRFLSWRSLR